MHFTTHERETTVLVVDDTQDKRQLMGTLLTQAGYRVALAIDGLEGFEVAQREHPHLVISDVAMPRADGIELCRRIRGDTELRTTPILLVSAHRKDAQSAVEGLEAGADDYLEAPYDPMHLIAKVARLIERARLEEHYREIVEQASDIIYTHDLDGRLMSINAAGAAFLRSTPENLMGRHLGLAFNFENAEAKVDSLIGSLLEGGSFSEPLEAKNSEGRTCWLDICFSLIHDRQGGVTGIRGVARDVTERKRAEDQLLHDAFHDALTGLPNRALFMDRLRQATERALRHPEYKFAVIFLDLDRFKVVNDSLGHMVGDKLLIEVGRHLSECLRASDTVARLGGDEFTLLVDDIHDVSDPIHLAERLQKRLNTSLRLGDHEVFTTASIGIAMSSLGYTHPHDLLRDADIAMHRAKSNGKACYQVFDTLMHSHAMELLRLETDLRRTVERQEYRIHYQPVMALGTGKIVGFEALLRWQHPDRGLLLPGEFISTAEETGLIVSIDRWVIREACRQASRWRRYYSGPDGAPLSISVNLSAKQFTHSNLAEELADILRETDLPPGCLNLEITESLLISNSEPVKALLSRLKAMGLELHLDDFGTGYSSLSYLHRFPIDVLKIDRSFVSRIAENGENSEIAGAIITMAHHLGMKVIAEGVETSSQLAHLKQLGCEYGQGNYFSPAVDVVMAEKLLEGESPPRG